MTGRAGSSAIVRCGCAVEKSRAGPGIGGRVRPAPGCGHDGPVTSTATCPSDDRVTTRRTRSRLLAAGAAVVVVCAGLGLRAVAGGDVAKYGGVALCTLMVMVLCLVVTPASSAARAASLALAASWAVEFFQLTGVPAELSGRSVLARLVLGSTFHAPDLFWYAVGAAVGWAALVVARRP